MIRHSGRLALAFIFVTVLIDAMGFGIVLPVFPKLIMTLTGQTIAGAARDAGWLGFAFATMQFLCGPLIGALSDRFGRRPVLIASLLAFAADYALCGLSPSLGWLFVGRIFAGITGASFTTAYAYIADISLPERRAQNFGLVGGAFGVGFILGPVIGGMLGGFGARMPFFVAAGLACVNVIFGIFVLTESLPHDRRRPMQLWRANPVGVLTQLHRQHPVVFGLAISIFLFQLGSQALPAVWAFFVIERFGWSSREIGMSLAVVGIMVATVQGGLIRVIIPRIGERRGAVIGLWGAAASMLVYALASHGWVVYVGILISAIGDIAYPSITALMSQRVEANAQGELQGAIASLTSLAAIIAPPAVTQLFAFFSGPRAPVYLPGAPFLFSTVLILATLVLVGWTMQRPVTPSALLIFPVSE